MKLNYEQKFKDRKPIETIILIKNFFSKYNFYIKEFNLRQNSSLTWSVHLKLYFNHTLIITSNGKGTSSEYCLASGYSELYERFCNKIYLLSNNYLNNKIIEQNYQNNNYYFCSSEKLISFEEAFSSTAGQYYLTHMQNESSELKELFRHIFYNKFIGIPYKNVINEDIIYMDPRIKLLLNNSSGMAAGNTFYEAFNQGMNEIYEHYVNGRYFSEQYDTYYAINLIKINNPLLQKIIAEIQKDNILYIFDMSYNYKMPVLMSVIINKYTHAITMNFGASPILDIAIERVLTELYQGIENHNIVKSQGHIPSSYYPDKRLMDIYWPGCTMTRSIFPEYIINNMVIIDSASPIFLQGQYSNKEIYEYLLYLNQQLNFNVYYFNCSLCEDLYAINIFVENIPYLLEDFSFADKIVDKTKHIQFLAELNNFINDPINQYDNLFLLIEENKQFKSYIDRYYLSLLQNKKNQFLIPSCLASSQNILEFIDIFLSEKNKFLDDNFTITSFIQTNAPSIYAHLNQYLIMKRYIDQINDYDIAELITIFYFLNLNISKMDIDNIDNENYWIVKIFFNDLNCINDNLYEDYINIMNNLNWSK